MAAALREASAAGVPVTIAGAGTGVTGGGVPLGGWVLSLEKLNRLEVHEGFAIAGAGVPLRDLQAAAQRSRPILSSRSHRELRLPRRHYRDQRQRLAQLSDSAPRAAGCEALAGGAGRWPRASISRAAMPSISTPAPIPLPAVTKNTAGYLLRPGMDWVDLFVGLGRHARRGDGSARGVAARAARACSPAWSSSPTMTRALDAVDRWRSTEARMLEYLDRPSLDLLRARFPEIPAAAQAAILFDQALASEDDAEVDAWLDRVEAAGAFEEESWFALSAADRERFRQFRHALPELVNDTVRRAGALKMNTDYAVPLARNREMLAYYRRRLEREFPGRYVDLRAHRRRPRPRQHLFRPRRSRARPAICCAEFARHAVALGGTVSAEHGLGKRKAHLLELQYSTADIEKMRAVKRRLDPRNILGRGTLLM